MRRTDQTRKRALCHGGALLDPKEKPKTDSFSIFLASEEGRREELMEGSWEMRRSAIGAASDSLGGEGGIHMASSFNILEH